MLALFLANGNANPELATVLGLAALVVVSLILAYAIKFTIGLRVKEEDEFTGLDLSLHGEKGYHLEEDLIGGSVISSGPELAASAYAVPAKA